MNLLFLRVQDYSVIWMGLLRILVLRVAQFRDLLQDLRHITWKNATIINCYNKEAVSGINLAGCICNNFGEGDSINCLIFGEISAPTSGRIVSISTAFLFTKDEPGNCNVNFTGTFYPYTYSRFYRTGAIELWSECIN